MSGWYESLASEDFAKARTRELLSRISALLDPERENLLPLEEVLAILKPVTEVYSGIKAVSLDRIVGSEGRYRDFNRHFLPRREHLRSRWVKVNVAQYEDIPLPPVRLYEIGGLYFVRDGNHRVSVARLRGQSHIDAEVSSLDSVLPLKPGMTLSELKRSLIDFEKRAFCQETRYESLTGDANLVFTSPGRYDVIREHIRVHKYYLNQNRGSEIGNEEALWSWHENVYRPIVAAIDEEGLLGRFPGRTASDLYVFIVGHWDELKRKYGVGFPIAAAARDYGQRYGEASPASRLATALGSFACRILARVAGRLGIGPKDSGHPKDTRKGGEA